MALRSEAYDFEMFETRYDNTVPAISPKEEPRHDTRHRDNVVELPREELDKIRRAKPKPLHITLTAVIGAVIMVLGVAMVYSQQQLAVLTEQINTATQTLAESQSLEVQLNMRASQTLSASQVEQYAEQNGMSKVNSGQITYVNVEQQDKGVVLETTEGGSVLDRLIAKVKSWFA